MKSQVKTMVLVSAIFLTLGLAVQSQIPNVLARTHNMGTFTFDIPKGCKVDKGDNRFQTDRIHLDCGSNKEVTFELDTSGLVNIDATPVADLENILTTVYDGAEIFESGADKYTINNHTAPYALATWTHTGHNLFGAELTKDVAGMAIAIKIGDKVVIGQYLAPQDDFDKFLKRAEATFKSVTPTASAFETPTPTSQSEDTNAG